MGKSKFNTDRIIGLSAMMISLLTLVIFIYQTNLIRTQSRLSVTPRIDFITSNDSPNTTSYDSSFFYSIRIENKGLGPAIIESIKIVHKGKEYRMDFRNFMDEAFPDFKNYGQIVQNWNIDTGSTLSPKESIKLGTFSVNQSKIEDLMKYLGVVDGDKMPYDIEVTYSSIYGEKWYTHLHEDGHPTKL